MSTEQNRKTLTELLEALSTGRVMQVFDQIYHEDVVMQENAEHDPKRIGRAANHAYEQYFADNAQWHGAKVGAVIVDGDHSAYEMWMDLTFQGQRMQRTQVAVQTWKDGKIVKEVFYYKG